jgi:hypothetical protein
MGVVAGVPGGFEPGAKGEGPVDGGGEVLGRVAGLEVLGTALGGDSYFLPWSRILR